MRLRKALQNIIHYSSSPSRIAQAFRALLCYRIIANSEFFDGKWFLSQNLDLARSGADPVLNYLAWGRRSGNHPSPDFVGNEYCDLHGIRHDNINPLVHYERIGKKRGFAISYLEVEQAGGVRDGIFHHTRLSLPRHQASFTEILGKIRTKVAKGERIRVVYIVFSTAMFPARPLMDAMLAHPLFDVSFTVVPDLRGSSRGADSGMQSCASQLLEVYPESIYCAARPDANGVWPDMLDGADIVCYPNCYDTSDYHYNPRWAVGRPFLPIQVNYGYYRSTFDRDILAGQNYAYFWKVFFASEETLTEYKNHSILKGANGVVTGYVKMDALAKIRPPVTTRKRILVALHHSVEGKSNPRLNLSNFQRYAKLFQELPSRYRDMDFIFRPHPYLFPTLAQPGLWGSEAVDAYVCQLKAQRNVFWNDGNDYFPVFAASDGAIQECGSFLVEYFYTGMPCCYMLKSPDDITTKFTPLGQDCLANCYQAFSETDIVDFLENVIRQEKDTLAERREAFRRRVMVNYPHAADVALDTILNEIAGGGLSRPKGAGER